MNNIRNYIFRYIKVKVDYSEDPKKYFRQYMKKYRFIIKKEKQNHD